MKKISIISVIGICISLLFSISCLEDRETTVQLNLGTPTAGVISIHIAVYDTTVEPGNCLLSSEFRPGTRATINVPTGDNRIFVVVAEDNTGKASEAGVSDPIDLYTAEASVQVKMGDLVGTLTSDLLYVNSGAPPYYYPNESKIGADTYIIYEGNGATNIEVYRGPSILNYNFNGGLDYLIIPYFSPFDLYADSEFIDNA